MYNNKKGFTLIEVLIALAIISIALTAVIHSTSQNIRNTIYLHHKAIANWAGTEIINETLAGILKLPEAPSTLDQETTLLGLNLKSQANLTTTPNPHIKEIHVDVLENSNSTKLISLTSYLYVT